MASFPCRSEAYLLRPGELALVTGGARSGKSRFALQLAQEGPFKRRLFVATAVATDPEMRRRIARHRRQRNGLWQTLEEPLRLPERLPSTGLGPGGMVLVDCLATFVTNLLLAKRSGAEVLSRIRGMIRRLHHRGLSSILVTNEVGLGIVPEYPLGRAFRDLLGQVNQTAAVCADRVYLLVAGIPMRIK